MELQYDRPISNFAFNFNFCRYTTGDCLAALWTAVAQPLMFGLIGAAVDVRTMSGAVVGKGLALLALGLAVRAGMAFMVVPAR